MSTGRFDPDGLAALSPWAGELAKTFVSLASDIALVVDDSGVITSVEQSPTEPIAPGAARWVGRPWVETVSGETRRKVELLLQEVTSTGSGRRREVNHVGVGGGIPVAYTAIRLGAHGPVLAVGRDLRAIAAIQQRFLNSQQELERGYWRVREAETRERRLRQVATDAMLVVDAPTLSIVQAGDTLATMTGAPSVARLHGRVVSELFDAHSRGPLDELLVAARSMGRPVEIRARLAGSHSSVSVAATPFRSGDLQRLLVRLRGIGGAAETPLPGDALVMIGDSSGRLLSCTPALAAFAAAQSEDALIGRPVAEPIGADPQVIAELLALVRRNGLAEASVMLAGGAGARLPVRIQAALLTEGDQECIGFTFRPQGARAAAGDAPNGPSELAAALDALAGRLGQVGLRDLVREAGSLIEQHLIERALQRSGGDEGASAALLGVQPATLRRRRRRTRQRDTEEGSA